MIPTPLGQDPLVLFLLVLFLIFMLFSSLWWVSLLIFIGSYVLAKIRHKMKYK